MLEHGEPRPPYPERYAKGVWLFNHHHFFECHEMLEQLWLESIGTEKTFYQMIIHAAVCFVHWENGNRKGVLSLHHTFELKSRGIPTDSYMGLDIAQLRVDMEALAGPLRKDPGLPLASFEKLAAPQIRVIGFEPLPVDEQELLALGRHLDEETAG